MILVWVSFAVRMQIEIDYNCQSVHFKYVDTPATTDKTFGYHKGHIRNLDE